MITFVKAVPFNSCSFSNGKNDTKCLYFLKLQCLGPGYKNLPGKVPGSLTDTAPYHSTDNNVFK